MGLAAAAIGVGGLSSVASSVIGSNAAQSAAQIQANAATTASNNTLAEFNQTQKNLSPFVQAGQSASNQLQAELPSLTAQFQPTMAQLQATPGYQFTEQQGLQATQNSYAAQGLGSSGSAQKGAAQYAEGLASTTYQQQFQNYLSQNQQIYNMLGGQQQLGENAAAMTGSQGLQATGQAGNYLTSGAAATAAGTVGSANAITGGISNVGSSLSTLGLLSALSSNNGIFSGSSAGTTAGSLFPGGI